VSDVQRMAKSVHGIVGGGLIMRQTTA